MPQQKILIVEDDPMIVTALEFLMEQNGYQVLTADHGEAAIQLADTETPDLILLDVMLPERSGFEVCQHLRTLPHLQKIKIILLTAKGREADIQKGLTFGADAYVTKPFSNRELIDTIQNLLAS